MLERAAFKEQKDCAIVTLHPLHLLSNYTSFCPGDKAPASRNPEEARASGLALPSQSLVTRNVQLLNRDQKSGIQASSF